LVERGANNAKVTGSIPVVSKFLTFLNNLKFLGEKKKKKKKKIDDVRKAVSFLSLIVTRLHQSVV
jgi:uncharacterized protein YhbP (UPF0306 family)